MPQGSDLDLFMFGFCRRWLFAIVITVGRALGRAILFAILIILVAILHAFGGIMYCRKAETGMTHLWY